MSTKYTPNLKYTALNFQDKFEVTTKVIMSEAFERAGEHTDTYYVQRGLARAFVAAHATAGTADRWRKLAEALTWAEYKPEQVTQVLTRMVRKGWLRSRVHNGNRLYEVNY